MELMGRPWYRSGAESQPCAKARPPEAAAFLLSSSQPAMFVLFLRLLAVSIAFRPLLCFSSGFKWTPSSVPAVHCFLTLCHLVDRLRRPLMDSLWGGTESLKPC